MSGCSKDQTADSCDGATDDSQFVQEYYGRVRDFYAPLVPVDRLSRLEFPVQYKEYLDKGDTSSAGDGFKLDFGLCLDGLGDTKGQFDIGCERGLAEDLSRPFFFVMIGTDVEKHDWWVCIERGRLFGKVVETYDETPWSNSGWASEYGTVNSFLKAAKKGRKGYKK
eukprot:GFYU01011843.1.p1 GENE.GFYU01011843.1~~GFYU01011843.1.p1  ORF type:complete len:167 (-),score=16.61 GFYU01011843.1:205-705(-)